MAIREMLHKIGPIAQLSPMTKTSAAEIMREIERVRRQGYSINDQEIEIGLRPISEVLPILRRGADTLRAML